MAGAESVAVGVGASEAVIGAESEGVIGTATDGEAVAVFVSEGTVKASDASIVVPPAASGEPGVAPNG